jgi:hypothetical protein
MRGLKANGIFSARGGVIMIALRGFVLFVSVLLIGCATALNQNTDQPCPGPGLPSAYLQRCTYVLQVLEVDIVHNEVKAVIHPMRKHPDDESAPRYGDGGRDEVFSFRVVDIEHVKDQLMDKNKAQIFSGISGSSSLELMTEATRDKSIDYLRRRGSFR